MNTQLKITDKDKLVKDSIKKAMSYDQFKEEIKNHVNNGTSSGPYQSEALANYTTLTHARLKRLDKTLTLPQKVIDIATQFKGNQTWLVLTESWCGDAAHAMPVLKKITDLTKHITFKVLYRDKNLDLMNAFLTNGTMSIPKLIVFDNNTQKIVGDWGPSPSYVFKKTQEFKTKYGKLTPDFKKEMQQWYNKDKGQTIVQDLVQFLY